MFVEHMIQDDPSCAQQSGIGAGAGTDDIHVCGDHRETFGIDGGPDIGDESLRLGDRPAEHDWTRVEEIDERKLAGIVRER